MTKLGLGVVHLQLQFTVCSSCAWEPVLVAAVYLQPSVEAYVQDTWPLLPLKATDTAVILRGFLTSLDVSHTHHDQALNP